MDGRTDACLHIRSHVYTATSAVSLEVRRHTKSLSLTVSETGHAVRVNGTYVPCRHLVCAGSQSERGLPPSGWGTTAGADKAVTAISVPAVTVSRRFNGYRVTG